MNPQEFHEFFLKATKSKSNWIWAHGQCYQYAYCFLTLVGGQGISYTTKTNGGHIFIKYQDKYFDSENSHGIASWKRLQSYLTRASNTHLTTHRSIQGIINLWFKFRPQELKECQTIIENIKKLSSPLKPGIIKSEEILKESYA